MDKQQKAPVFSYGIGSLGKDLIGGMATMYLLVFYTDVFGISAAAAGIIMMVARIWDAVNDPLMGTIVDRTNTKWGRFRPYLFVMPVVMGVCYVLTFTTPNLSMTGKIAFATITYILAGMSFTAYDVPLWGMVPAISSDSNVRNKLITAQRIFTTFSYLIVGSFVYPMIFALGGGQGVENQREGFFKVTLIFAIVGICCAWVTAFRCKEHVKIPSNKSSVKQLFTLLRENKHALKLIACTLFMYLPGYISGAVTVYYLQYYLERLDLITLFSLACTIAGIVGMMFVVKIADKIGRMKITVIGVVLAIITNGCLFFAGKNIALILVLLIINNICVSVHSVTLVSMIADASDYTQWKSKIRIDGVIFSLNSFVIKLASAVASGIVGITLAIIGYVPNAAIQTETALMGINLLRFAIPIIPFIIGLIILKKYSLTDEEVSVMRKELAEENSVV